MFDNLDMRAYANRGIRCIPPEDVRDRLCIQMLF